jgi:hypothetical protein
LVEVKLQWDKCLKRLWVYLHQSYFSTSSSRLCREETHREQVLQIELSINFCVIWMVYHQLQEFSSLQRVQDQTWLIQLYLGQAESILMFTWITQMQRKGLSF